MSCETQQQSLLPEAGVSTGDSCAELSVLLVQGDKGIAFSLTAICWQVAIVWHHDKHFLCWQFLYGRQFSALCLF